MLDLNAGIYGASAAQNHLGKQGEIKVKREASPLSTSSSTNDIMKERRGYMSRTPPFGDPTTEDSKKRALDEDAELEKKVAKFQPPTIESQQAPALPSSVTGIRNTRNATMQRLLPKIVHQSVADKLYPPHFGDCGCQFRRTPGQRRPDRRRWVTPGGWIRCQRALILDQARPHHDGGHRCLGHKKEPGPGLGIEPMPGIEPTVMK